jgi:hypothetical protein
MARRLLPALLALFAVVATTASVHSATWPAAQATRPPPGGVAPPASGRSPDALENALRTAESP